MNSIQLQKLLEMAHKEKYNEPSNFIELTIFVKGEMYPKIEYYSLNIRKGIFADKLEIFIKYKTENKYDRDATFTYTDKSYINTVKEIIYNRNRLYHEKENLTFEQALTNSLG